MTRLMSVEWSGRTIKESLAVVAVGGNSLIKDKAHQSVADQFEAFRPSARAIAGLVKEGLHVILTHGNGPQVGFILRRSELSRHELHEVPLDACVADTQGALGYLMQQLIGEELRALGQDTEVATVVTQVCVDANDPSFQRPDKPIGSFMSAEEAEVRRVGEGWQVVEDAGRGWRRVVASPEPKEIIEESAIRFLAQAGYVVVAVGGGGVPVVRREDGTLRGVAAVIDKDRASSLLARRLHAHYLIITTAVDKVYLNYGKKDQRGLYNVTVAQIRHYMKEAHFKAGSMLPKIEAAVDFLEAGGNAVIITNPENLLEAMEGRAGTWIVRD
jgi:carbamate kinase